MKLRSFLVCALAAILPAVAAAQQARALNAVALRAGPDSGYPFVIAYGPGTPLAVQGCTDGYGWCDVVGPDGYRGWVYAGDIAYPYQRREVPVLGYGAVVGIPIITFALGSYWASHYNHRVWYRDRDRWDHYRPVYGPGYGRPGYRPDYGRPGYRPDHGRPGYRPDPGRPGHRPGNPPPVRPLPGPRPPPVVGRPDRPHDRPGKMPRGGVVEHHNGKPAGMAAPPRGRNNPASQRGPN